jgi:hypothetical protein
MRSTKNESSSSKAVQQGGSMDVEAFIRAQ